MMKIAYISYEFPTYTGFGGIATYIKKISNIMADNGHFVHIITVNPGALEDVITREGLLIVHYLGVPNQKAFQKRLPDYLLNFKKEKKFDFIECAEYGGDPIFALKIIPEIAQKFIVRLHGITILSLIYDSKSLISRKWLYFIAWIGCYKLVSKVFMRLFPSWAKLIQKNQWERKVVLSADIVTVPSFKMNDFITYYWQMPTNALHKIPNPGTFAPEYRNSFSDTKIRVGYVNRCQHWKGFDLFVYLVNEVYHRRWDGKSYHFEIYGAIEEQVNASLLRKYRPIAKHNLTIHGRVAPAKVEGAMCALDCLILPSRYESFSIVLLEAMSKGCIVCVSDGVGAAEIITDGENGFLFRSGDKRTMLEAFRRITLLSDEERLRISRNASRMIEENFSDEHILQKYLEVYVNQVNR